jgi:alcohol dehydrogenase class IV
MEFSIIQPPRIDFGRGKAAGAVAAATGFGARGIVVHGANPARAAWFMKTAKVAGADLMGLACGGEPTLADLEAAILRARPHRPDWVIAIGGGAVLDLGKALAAMLPAPGGVMDHLEGVGRGLPLQATPLPFIALPTTSGTGAEVTKNAVIGVPEQGRKVSLRDDRMIARVAIVDPALTDGCPPSVTLASGLDALTQVIEPYVSCRATPYTDAITLPVILPGLRALIRLREGEDASARDTMALMSLTGGLALANAGLGAVHGFAGVIGGITGAAHGAICGTLLGPVLLMNRRRATGEARARIDRVCALLAEGLGCSAEAAPSVLAGWARAQGLPGLAALGLGAERHPAVAEVALTASSMKGNPVALSPADLCEVLAQAS